MEEWMLRVMLSEAKHLWSFSSHQSRSSEILRIAQNDK